MGIHPSTGASTSCGRRSSGGLYNSIKHNTRSSMAASASKGSINDYYASLAMVVAALACEGLEQCKLIIGIHFTKCNYRAGDGPDGDPYERAFSIIEKTLAPFDEDNLYPCFGFGDEAENVFSFHSDHSPCDGIEDVLACYNKIVPNVTRSGPTSYAPVIDAAVNTVEKRSGQFHTLVLVADIQATTSFFKPWNGKLSSKGRATIKSIVNASSYPLSIVLVGVGYGSWEHMKKFQDTIPTRNFDNFQFISFSEIYMNMTDATPSKKEAAFAFAALKEIPLHYKAAVQLGIIGCLTGNAKKIVLCNPPVAYTHHALPTSEPSDLPLPVSVGVEQCLQEVTDALWKGLESSKLIVGIGFPKNNEWAGKASFNDQSQHAIGDTPNPYEKVLSLIKKSFGPLQEEKYITCFGFGDATTLDHEVFSFHSDHSPCYGFEEVLVCYKRIVRNVKIAGKTSYAPVIEAAVDIVEKSGGDYHVLVIIAASQVTRSSHTGNMELSPQEEETIRSIADASSYPLFIILVGVGDGPWDDMKKLFDETIPKRDNFQFVDFNEIMSTSATPSEKEAAFALAALEVPIHYKAAVESGIVGRTTGKANKIVPRPPPVPCTHSATPPAPEPSDLSAPAANYQRQMVCPVCLINEKDMAFGCGHMVCRDCASSLSNCPICRKLIDTRLRLFHG